MQWWDYFVNWFYSDAGSYVVSTAIVPGLAILVAGIIAALIGRGSTKRIVSLHSRAERTAAVTAMIGAARRAANWNSLSVSEQQLAEHIALECDVRLRLLPTAGSGMAAEWSAHQLADLKKQAVSFSFQASQTLKEFKDRLIEWQSSPGRAKRLFKNDLDSWAYESSLSDQDLVAQQRAWESQQTSTNAPVPEVPESPLSQQAPTIEPTPMTSEAQMLRVATAPAPDVSTRVEELPRTD